MAKKKEDVISGAAASAAPAPTPATPPETPPAPELQTVDASEATHEVVRDIPGTDLKAGDLVNAKYWRNAPKLERMRYLAVFNDIGALRERVAKLEAEVRELKSAKK